MSASDLLHDLLASEAAAAVATALAMQPDVDHIVKVQPMGDAALVALGEGRYVNRAIGVSPNITTEDVATIAQFYNSAGLPPSLQLSSAASQQTLAMLTDAGFRPAWFRGVHTARIPAPVSTQIEADPAAKPPADLRIVAVDETNLTQWLDTLAAGNGINAPAARAISDEHGRAAHAAHGATDFLALDAAGRPLGCGSVQIANAIAWLGGAATRPSARSQGVQTALLQHRLQFATDQGCERAAATAVPEAASARNLTRAGLALIDTQLVLTKIG